MRARGVLVSVIVFLSALVMIGGSAKAETISTPGQQLHVYAKVLPAQHVIIDKAGRVIYVASNTDQDIETPRVYIDTISAETEVRLTPAVYAQFRSIIPLGESRIGELYDKRNVPPESTPLKTFSPHKLTTRFKIVS